MRRQLPVYSPVSWGAVVAGVGAALGRRDGEAAARFVEMLKARYGARDVLLTDSGTSALRLAIEGAVGDSGRPVALPGYGCYDLASAAEGAGTRVALYDVDPPTLGPDPDSLQALRHRTPAAVVVAHWFGHLADALAAGKPQGDAVLIEDAAQGVGGCLYGRPLGSFGSLAVLSFGRGKGTTGGGGGALLAHDERGQAIVTRARGRLGSGGTSARQVLALTAQLLFGRPALYGIPAALPFLHLGETVYRPPRPPREIGAACLAVLEAIWAEADREVAVRRRNAARLTLGLRRSSRLRPIDALPGGEPGFLRLPALVREGGGRTAVLDERARRLGIASGYPTTLAALPSLVAHLTHATPLPGAATLADSLITLPTHSLLTERDLTALEAWLAAV